MMNLREVNNALDHKIVGGSEHLWKCYPNGRFLDYESDYAHASVVFDTETQMVYCAEVTKKDHDVLYRWINPDYLQAYKDEALERNVDPNLAWDNVKWVDLEVDKDWCTKANAIMNNKSFDNRIEVPLDLDNDLLLELALQAHKRDITINKMVELIIQEVIDNNKSTESTAHAL